MRFAPSKAHRWVTGGCTGSVRAESEAPRRPESEAAKEGKRLHSLAEAVTNGRVACEDMSSDDRHFLRPYLRLVDDIRALATNNVNIETPLPQSVTLPDGGVPDAAVMSTASVAIALSDAGPTALPGNLNPDTPTVIVADLKTGHRPVAAKENIQLLMYAIAMGAKAAMLFIVQPRLSAEPDAWFCEDLSPWRCLVLQRIYEAKHGPKLVATGSNCTGCAAVVSCPAARMATLGGADLAMEETSGLPGDFIRVELVKLRNAKQMITTRLDALEAEAEARIRSGEQIQGCAISVGRAGRLAWTQDPAHIEEQCKLAGVDPVKHSLITPTQAIKAGVPEDVIADLATRGQGKAKVTTDAGDMFDDGN